jgi:hypothetical protein
MPHGAAVPLGIIIVGASSFHLNHVFIGSCPSACLCYPLQMSFFQTELKPDSLT